MTEQEWLEGDDILEFLEEKLSPRTLRLYLCACVRRIWYLLTDERSRHPLKWPSVWQMD